ncbi:MAG: DUF721 domain-containing protein [Desulfobulbus sp.]|jgi:predicted nucleic acid-binding Zn ribbon protein
MDKSARFPLPPRPTRTTTQAETDRSGEPVRIGDLLPALYSRRQWTQPERIGKLTRDWPAIVGEQVAKLTEPAFFRHDVLWIHVQDAAWMHHLQFVKLEWLERINRALADEPVRDLRWRLAPQPPPFESRARAPVHSRPIDPAREQAFFAQTEAITDPDCREALRRLWRTFAACGSTDPTGRPTE